jgi:hypothetical protein
MDGSNPALAMPISLTVLLHCDGEAASGDDVERI